MSHEGKKGKGKRSKGSSNVVLPYEAKLNDSFITEECIKKMHEAFTNKESETLECGITMHSDPFQCCHMTRLIGDEQFLEGLRDELLDQIFYEKNNDLYSFQQTDDLKKLSSPHVKLLRKFFNEDFRQWLSTTTGITFTDRIDLTCSKYDSGDILLCHDDELDSRRIAFAFYLVPSWSEQDGGYLDLFSMDENGLPKEVVTSILPAWNSISWFEVTEASHHQVSEILSDGKSRLSVNGWFHTAPIPRSPRYIEPKRPLHEHIHIEEQMVYEWLNPIYLDPAVQTEIREKFSDESEIELQEFLKEEKYQELVSELSRTDLPWTRRGPANKRCYSSLTDNDMPEIVRQCLRFLQSEAIFLVLSNLTGLRLHELATQLPDSDNDDESDDDDDESDDEIPTLVDGETFDKQAAVESKGRNNESKGSPERIHPPAHQMADFPLDEAPEPEMVKRQRMSTDSVATSRMSVDSVCVLREDSHEEKKKTKKNEKKACDPRCRYEVRRWRHGCYTLVHDTDAESAEYALDANFYCLPRDWLQEYGGYTSYIAKAEDEELLTVCPAVNSLALVYRDKDTLKFVKHVNHKSVAKHKDSEFYDFSFAYYEYS